MDFFDAQARARSRTLLVLPPALAALAIIIALVYGTGLLCWHFAERDDLLSEFTRIVGAPSDGWWHPWLFFLTTCVVTLIVGAGSIDRLLELSDGGNAIAHSLRARLVRYDTTALRERRLVNVVEELSIASGVRIPEIFILDEDAINSFCAGHTPDTAVLIVTQGAVDVLSRDELQAMLAHEFSHILNGDMRINTLLVGVLHGFLMFSITGQNLIFLRNPVFVVAGVLFIVIGHLGRVLGSAIQSLLCRQREWLADAHAVQFTRNPGAIVSALKKIGGHRAGSFVPRPHAIEAAHMFFANPLDTRWFFSSHPSLTRRIRAIDPRFDGVFPRLKEPGVVPFPAGTTWKQAVALRKHALRQAAGDPEPATPPPAVPATPAALAAAAASASSPPLAAPVPPAPVPPAKTPPPAAAPPAAPRVMDAAASAAAIIDSIPAPLREAARDPALAPAVFFGLLLQHASSAQNASARKTAAPLAAPPGVISPGEQAWLDSLRPQFAALSDDAQLALADLALPALRALAPGDASAFLKTVDALVLADRRVSLHEFALRHMARRHLQPPDGLRAQPGGLARPIAVVLAALAHAGHPGSPVAGLAYRSGVEALPGVLAGKLSGPCPAVPPPPEIMDALRKLDAAPPRLKEAALAAFARAIGHDGLLAPGEAALLRIITVALDRPAPPPCVFT
ncbi:MAG: M48 family metalloprotease [Opitutaceae bacterium]|jgi:Zn-dependent protease with chaperone function|nr:M48 family metalloprotease [Opitutaceae bacterium]